MARSASADGLGAVRGSETTAPLAGAGDDLTVAYVGGGSREWAPKFVQDMALSSLGGRVRLYDPNREAAERNAAFGNWVQDRDVAVADWTYTVVGDLESALEGADVVFLSTQYDPKETFQHDLQIPKRYGVYGAVSATIGPGGIFRAMRTIPVYRRFARKVRDHCPDAWVIDFTNPVHFATRALYDEFPEINAIGLCHGVLTARSYLADLATEHGEFNADRGDISINLKGINHFTWTDEVRCKGIDLWPLLEELTDQPLANRTFTAEDLADASPFVDNHQVTWEAFRRFDVFPVIADRHLVEYLPSFLNGGEEGLNRWGVKRTDSEYRSKHWNPDDSEQTSDVEAWMSGDRSFELSTTSEVFVDIVEALSGQKRFVTNVNLPNTGQVADVEEGAVVETNAVIQSGEIRPVAAGGFPRPVRSRITTHVDTIETVVEASRSGDLDQAFRGFLNDPQVGSLAPDAARDLFAELVAAEEEYLSDWEIEVSDTLDASSRY